MPDSYEIHVTQVVDGAEYTGHLKVGRSTLAYQLFFPTPIQELPAQRPDWDLEEMRQKFHIEVKKDEKEIPLTDDEYRLFFFLLVGHVMEFYERARHVVGAQHFGAETCVFPPKVREIFNSPKFDCALPA